LCGANYGQSGEKVVAAGYHAQNRELATRFRGQGRKSDCRSGNFARECARGQVEQYQTVRLPAQDQQAWEVCRMCRVFAGQDPEGYRQINRSIRIDGHSTSIQLEATFWALLDEIAENQNLTTPKFISKLYDEAIEINGAIPNFASMLRTTCALYLRGHRPGMDEQAMPKRQAA